LAKFAAGEEVQPDGEPLFLRVLNRLAPLAITAWRV
jgi:hypothetical protein